MAYAERRPGGLFRARWRGADGKLHSTEGFPTELDAVAWGDLKEAEVSDEAKAEAALRAALDPLIRPAVTLLRDHGVDTYESCSGHPEEGRSSYPFIAFEGDEQEGFRVVWMLERAGYRVMTLERHWSLGRLRLTGAASWQVWLDPLICGDGNPDPSHPERRDRFPLDGPERPG